MIMRTYKIKKNSEVIDSFEESCWYNAERVFTDKMIKGLRGYLFMSEKEDVESYGIEWEGPGFYGDGDFIPANSLISAFYDGTDVYTINAL